MRSIFGGVTLKRCKRIVELVGRCIGIVGGSLLIAVIVTALTYTPHKNTELHLRTNLTRFETGVLVVSPLVTSIGCHERITMYIASAGEIKEQDVDPAVSRMFCGVK